jgi:hypothetical protein
VAPLTTVVMNSVKQDRVGTASGISNAVARVAGVLAIAIFGIVMVNAFSFHLNRGLARLDLPSYILLEVQANEIRLAGLQLPAGLDPIAKVAIKNSVSEARGRIAHDSSENMSATRPWTTVIHLDSVLNLAKAHQIS